ARRIALLRRRAGIPAVHAACRFPRPSRPRRAALRPSRASRSVAPSSGARAHPRPSPGPAYARAPARAREPPLGALPDGSKVQIGVESRTDRKCIWSSKAGLGQYPDTLDDVAKRATHVAPVAHRQSLSSFDAAQAGQSQRELAIEDETILGLSSCRGRGGRLA